MIKPLVEPTPKEKKKNFESQGPEFVELRLYCESNGSTASLKQSLVEVIKKQWQHTNNCVEEIHWKNRLKIIFTTSMHTELGNTTYLMLMIMNTINR